MGGGGTVYTCHNGEGVQGWWCFARRVPFRRGGMVELIPARTLRRLMRGIVTGVTRPGDTQGGCVLDLARSGRLRVTSVTSTMGH